MNHDKIEVLEKLAVIGGEHHDAYLVQLAKYNQCKHLRTQTYTEYCLDCGYNTWYGPDPQDFLDRAMAPPEPTVPEQVAEVLSQIKIEPLPHITREEAMRLLDQIEHAKIHDSPDAIQGYAFACQAMRELIDRYFDGMA